MPLVLSVNIPVEMNFSVWDGADRESVDLGGRLTEVEEKVRRRATLSLEITDFDRGDQRITFLEGDLDTSFLVAELGNVNVFDLEERPVNDEE
ncbi:hypothetical protein [Leisingera sp. ANG-Vp]|uniref:hypothetical protein n=1 Tax=Leisingera sp. ANG-Vp TaxID=1577896 RepID=UPI001269CDB4|nr:hypothetical protein [Leisingera sp. ANG-Vp]